jgi:transcriptional regulator with XRE-family HTH domain
MTLTAAQCRAARGFLGWSQADLGQRAKAAAKTIIDFERGARSPHPRTLEALAKALEEEGIVFLGETETYLLGVAVRPGSQAAKRLETGGGANVAGENGSKAMPWDEELPVPAEIANLRAYWRDRPREWAALSEIGRQTLSEKMYGASDVADAAFGQGLNG